LTAAAASAGAAPLELPLAHTSVHAQVAGNVARVEVTQLYQNPSRVRLEAIYAFPLPENAAVTDMMFRIGKRVVLSQVKRRGEARKTYEAAKTAGHTAALTEEERPNLFTQSVANIPPGESVEVVLRYVHEIPLADGRYRYHFPTTIGPRYIPGGPTTTHLKNVDPPPGEPTSAGAGRWSPDTARVPDASRVTPPVLPPGLRSAADVDITVELKPAAAFDDVAAVSHRIATGTADGSQVVTLAADDRIPNKDFVLSWRPAGSQPEARLLTDHERGDDYFMLFVQPPAQVAPAQIRPREMVFLIDKSGSMSGAPLATAARLVTQALAGMGPDDTFQLIAFDSATTAMTPQALPNTPTNRRAGAAWMSSLTGSGGTEMLAGIRTALRTPADPRRLRMVIFLTDGFIGNEAEIIQAVADERNRARVFGFGIGTSVNRYLIEGVSRAGRGASDYVERFDDSAEAAAARLYRHIDRPVLTDLKAIFEGIDVRELEPTQLPDLFAGEPLVVVGKAGAITREARLILTGRLGDQPFRRVVTLPAPGPHAARDLPVLGTLWARRRVAELSDYRPGGASADEQAEIVALALKWKLVTQFTSFVAVERTLSVDTRLPLAEVLVPNELPEGVSYEDIFGASGASEVEMTPVRVKPGDPELRIRTGASARAARLTLPFLPAPVEAVRDGRDFVARFLVPPATPDGSYDGQVTIVHAGGRVETQSVAVRVDTTAAALAVVSQPPWVVSGQAFDVAFKPALPVGVVQQAIASRPPGGVAAALKSAIDVKDVLVRAPWGEIVRAEMQGPLGSYRATLHAPAALAPGNAQLEVVASDTAGNVSRRMLDLTVTRAAQTPAPTGSYVVMGWAAGLALVLLLRVRVRMPGAKGAR
jgi:Ca-activated chloride channel family protein